MTVDDEVPLAVSLDAAGDDEPGLRLDAPVPVTLITGFLGSGKTTLVRHLLSEYHGYRIAVILNEFGEGNIEGAFLKADEGLRAMSGEWVELDNGCMCCSVKSDFVQALEALMLRREKFDYIVVETTGLANPGPIAASLWTDDESDSAVQLDAIITVVDGLHLERQLHEARPQGAVNEAAVQVAYADLVLLNKMDLCAEEAVVLAEADIRAINSSVQIMRTTHCRMDVGQLLNRHGYKHGAEVALPPIAEDGGSEEEGEEEGPRERQAEASTRTTPSRAASLHRKSLGGCHSRPRSRSRSRTGSGSVSECEAGDACEDASHDHHHHHHHGHRLDDLAVASVTLKTEKPLDLEKFKAFMDRLLWEREGAPNGPPSSGANGEAEEIYRVKGVLAVVGQQEKHMVQAVYELYSVTGSRLAWGPEESRESRVVVIGRHLNQARLEAWFAGTVAA